MTHWKMLFDYEHLGAQDLPRDAAGNVGEIIVTIVSIAKKTIKGKGGKEDVKPVAVLRGADKPMILNKVNLERLQNLFETTEYEQFIGKPFILYKGRDRNPAGGGMVDCLRVKEEKPVIAEKVKPELNPMSPKWPDAIKAIKAGNSTAESLKNHFTITPENEALLKQHENKI